MTQCPKPVAPKPTDDLLGDLLRVKARQAARSARAKLSATVGDGSPSGPDPAECDQILEDLAVALYGLGYYENGAAAMRTLIQELRDEFARLGCVV